MKKFLIIFLSLASAATLFAATGGKRGTAGAQELLIPIGGRGVALGGSILASVQGSEAMFWNPAGIAYTPRQMEAIFFHQNHLYDIAHIFSGAAVNLGDAGAIGFHIKYLDIGKIPVTTVDQPEGTGATYTPSFITYGVSYGRAFTDMIALGTTIKLITEQVMDAAAYGFAFDFGLQYRTGVRGLLFGFAIQNVGDNMRFDGESLNEPNTLLPKRTVISSFALPTTIQIGVSYNYTIDETNALLLNGKIQSNSFDTDQYVTGIEYGYNNQFFLRGSYEFHSEALTDAFGKNTFTYNFAAGAGMYLHPAEELDMKFEYAYRNSDIFSGGHSFSLKIAM